MSRTSSPSSEIRRRLDHPVVDADGHTTEFGPALGEYLREVGLTSDFNVLFRDVLGAAGNWYELTPEQRRRQHLTKAPWWTRPMRNTEDRAAACFPRLLRERMDVVGCDVSVVYPSTGLGFFQLRSGELRRAACRALNRYHRDAFEGCTDRLVPVAAVPAHTPQEGIEELEHAVLELGYRAVVIPSYIPRPVPGFEDADPETSRWAFWLDTYGIDSDHDYDPFWRRCIELGVSPATHTQGNGWGSRRSPTNWVYNHIGHFAATGEALCKSLFLGGVTRRFPQLRIAMLEGGVGWACSLYSDLVAHWDKRNLRAIRENLDPDLLDQAAFQRLAVEYGPVGAASRERIRGAVLTTPGHERNRPSDADLDEFAALGIESAEEIRDLFVPNFYFGCEADDPMNVVAFQTRLWPFGARLNAMYGSDIGHFDVPEMSDVLHEAHELVEAGAMTDEQFRDFVWTNPVRFYTDANPGFFDGTVVADEARRLAGVAGTAARDGVT
jgi:predicted TIM-barrel fold metal-dependent hydrolase